MKSHSITKPLKPESQIKAKYFTVTEYLLIYLTEDQRTKTRLLPARLDFSDSLVWIQNHLKFSKILRMDKTSDDCSCFFGNERNKIHRYTQAYFYPRSQSNVFLNFCG